MNQINLYRILAETVAVRLFEGVSSPTWSAVRCFFNGRMPIRKDDSPDLSFYLGIVTHPAALDIARAGDSPIRKNKTNKTLPPMPSIHNDHGVSPMRKKSEDQTWQGFARLQPLAQILVMAAISWVGDRHHLVRKEPPLKRKPFV
jgi:hypothetical protein